MRRFKVFFALLVLAVFCLSSVQAAERAVSVKPKKGAAVSSANSNYYAIIIGNNNYKHLRKLQTAVADATEVEKLLKDRYGFKTRLLLNATRSDILDSINEIREKLGRNDNLLVYYAGHGEYNKAADKAYWLPVDAHKDRTTNWIIADDITSNIKIITAKHVLVVSDSCYSGGLTRAATTELRVTGERQEYLKKMQNRPSRTLMASGGNEPVADSGGGRHSVFAAAFLKALKEADKPVFTADEIFHGRVKAIVAGKSDQVPEYNSIKNSGDEGGDFVFLAKGSVIMEEPQEPEPQEPASAQSTTGSMTVKSNVSKAKVYIGGKYQGETPVTKTLEAGNYEIEVRKDGYITGKETVRVERDKSKTVSLLLDKASGTIKISSDPTGAKIYLDGAYTDTTPGTIADLKPGSYKIKVTKDGYREYTANVRVTEGQEAEVSAELEELPKKKSASSSGGVIASGSKQSYTDPTTGMEFVLVKGGSFQMGDSFGDGESDEKPVHEVSVNDFYMGKYEVTVGQFRKFVNDTGYRTEAEKGDGCYVPKSGSWSKDSSKNWKDSGYTQDESHPVVCVSWNDAKAYADWQSRQTGKNYRLPTEAEWEYAAKAGTQTRNFWGNNKDDACRYANVSNKGRATGDVHDCDDGYTYTSPVGSFQPNGFGLHDMIGNAWEWTNDWYDSGYYGKSPRNNPTGPNSGTYRVLRGGSWSNKPQFVRASARNFDAPTRRYSSFGFRLARTN